MATDAMTVKVEFDKENAMNCIKNVLMEEYGMTLDELAELCKAKREGRLREDVQGEWNRVGFEKGFECSNCGSRCLLNYESDFYPSKFCPHCGARMAGGGER